MVLAVVVGAQWMQTVENEMQWLANGPDPTQLKTQDRVSVCKTQFRRLAETG
jgi:hypothetical protein